MILNKAILILALCSMFLSGCGNNVDYNRSDNVTDSQNNTVIDNSVAEDVALRENMFLQMANHDKYITGIITESYISDTYTDSYITVKGDDGETYRIEGFNWPNRFTNTPFSVADSQLLSNKLENGLSIIVFYDNTSSDDQYLIDKPKDVCIQKEMSTEQRKQKAEGIKSIAGRLTDNYNALPEHKVLNADEAILTVADYLGINDLEKSVDEYGTECYINEEYKLYFSTLWFSESFGMSDDEFIEYYQSAYQEYPHFLENLNNDEKLRNEPYIRYRIHTEYFGSDEQILNYGMYYLNIDGTIHTVD